MNIDFHAHIYPEDYLKKLEASSGDVRIETDAKGQKWILSMGARAGPIIPDFFDTDVRVDRIKEHRVDMQILSSPHPGVDRFSPDESAEMSRIINDGIAKAVRKYPKQFQGLAMLPLIDTKLALKELDRAVLDLGLKGMCMLTNVAGKMVDSEFLLPVYARAQELGVPIFIHPTTPLGAQVMQEWRLAIILGFEFDIVLSATRLGLRRRARKISRTEFRHLPSRRRHSLSWPAASTAVITIPLAASKPRSRPRNTCAISTATPCHFINRRWPWPTNSTAPAAWCSAATSR